MKTLNEIIENQLQEKLYYDEYYNPLTKEQIEQYTEKIIEAMVNNFLQYADYKKIIGIRE